MGRKSTVWQDVKWGLIYGIGLAAIYAAYVIVLFLFAGSEPFDELEVSLPAVLGAYFFGGLLGGVVLGLLRPLAKTLLAYMAVGMVVALPVVFGLVLIKSGPLSGWSRPECIVMLVLTTFYGIGGGYVAWKFRHL